MFFYFFQSDFPASQNKGKPGTGKLFVSRENNLPVPVFFYLDDQQKETAQKLVDLLKTKGYKVATQLSKASAFWSAEDYHQDYYMKKKGTPYCHIYTKWF